MYLVWLRGREMEKGCFSVRDRREILRLSVKMQCFSLCQVSLLDDMYDCCGCEKCGSHWRVAWSAGVGICECYGRLLKRRAKLGAHAHDMIHSL